MEAQCEGPGTGSKQRGPHKQQVREGVPHGDKGRAELVRSPGSGSPASWMQAELGL